MISIIRNFKFFLVCFIVTYLLTSFGIWVKGLYESRDFLQKPLVNYVQKHKEELKTVVFDELFPHSQYCSTLINDLQKKECEDEVTHKLGETIVKEEMSDPSAAYWRWPGYFFFVQETKDGFYRLTWQGNFQKIRSPNISYNKPYFIQFLEGSCNPFEFSIHLNSTCQIYPSIDLGNGKRGYLVGVMSLGDSSDLLFMFIFPFFVFLIPLAYITPSVLSGDFGTLRSLIIFGSPIYLGLFVGFFATLIYDRKIHY